MTPRFSVFTPSHRPKFLDDCYVSLAAQSFTDWEWVVVLNDGARWTPPLNDDRVRVTSAEVSGVGASKRYACEWARGEILVELDHDDLLASRCLELVDKAFKDNPGAAFVYSDTAQVLENGDRDTSRFNERNGWVYYDTTVDGRDVMAFEAMPPTPHNVSLIWFAPNHVRAFRRSAYNAAGGYDAGRMVLDDQDLMCRLFQQGSFVRITECLYLQRMHADNTQRHRETNAYIQEETLRLYARYVEGNARAWANRERLLALDFGAAHGRPPGYLGVDMREGPDVDIVAELPSGLGDLADNSVGVIRAVDFLEHVHDTMGLMEEIHRLLAPGGLLLSMTPSTDGRGAFQDPTHVSYFNENSFWYWTDQNLQRFVPEIKAQFQVSRLVTDFPSPWHKDHDIPYVTANLICLKEPMARNGGQINW